MIEIQKFASEIAETITGHSDEYWRDYYQGERERALSLGTLKRGQLFTHSEMFGYGPRRGWRRALGLDGDDIETVEVDAAKARLTAKEQNGDPKKKPLKRVIRFQIRDHVFDQGR
jgi:hypothetical protein